MADDYEDFLRRAQELQWIEDMIIGWDHLLGCVPTVTDDDPEPEPEPPAHSGVADKYFEKHIKRVDFGGPPPKGERKLPRAEVPQHTLNDTEGVHRAIGAASIRR